MGQGAYRRRAMPQGEQAPPSRLEAGLPGRGGVCGIRDHRSQLDCLSHKRDPAMTNFAILRTAKIKGRAHLKAAHNHNATQEHRPKHADPDKPVRIVAGSANALDEFNALVEQHNCTVRKNAVTAIEHVCSFSPEAVDKINLDQWVKDTVDFFKQHYGESNMLQAALHTDEKTPHLHIIVAPMIEKKHKKGLKTTLSARDWIGGPDGPKKLERLQTAYAAAVAHHGLERGIHGSKSKHKPLRELAAESAAFVKQAEKYVASKDIPYQDPRKTPAKKKGFIGIDWQASYENAAQRCVALKKQLNKALDSLKALKVLNKQLSYEKQRLEARVEDLERIQVDQGVETMRAENAALRAKNQALNAKVATMTPELESWRLGGQGLPLSPAVRAELLERQRERSEGPRNDEISPTL